MERMFLVPNLCESSPSVKSQERKSVKKVCRGDLEIVTVERPIGSRPDSLYRTPTIPNLPVSRNGARQITSC
mgnify:FL=1